MDRFSNICIKEDELKYLKDVFKKSEEKQLYADKLFREISYRLDQLIDGLNEHLPNDKLNDFTHAYLKPLSKALNNWVDAVNERTDAQNMFVNIMLRNEGETNGKS